MLGFDRITVDPNIMGGRACIRGMRVTVSLIANLFANGMSDEEILESYPYLEKEDLRQALEYDAELKNCQGSEIPNETTIKAFEEDKSGMPLFHSIEELRRDLMS